MFKNKKLYSFKDSECIIVAEGGLEEKLNSESHWRERIASLVSVKGVFL